MRTETLNQEQTGSLEDHHHDPVTDLAVEGMSCSNCARHVAEAIQTVPGVRNVDVSLESRRALVHWSAGAAREVPGLIKAVEQAGYKAQVIEPSHDHDDDHCKHGIAGWELNLWVGLLGTIPLMAGEWLLGLATVPWFQWFSFAFASVVQVIAGAPFYRGAWNQLRRGQSNMDTLVALGSTTAFVYSAWALLTRAGGHLYFMEAAAIITLISIGHWVESRVSLRASA